MDRTVSRNNTMKMLAGLALIGLIFVSTMASAGTVKIKYGCKMWVGNPYRIENVVYAGTSIECDNQKKSVTTNHWLEKKVRLGWPRMASSYSNKANVRKDNLITHYHCDNRNKTRKWRGESYFVIDASDSPFDQRGVRLFSQTKSLACND